MDYLIILLVNSKIFRVSYVPLHFLRWNLLTWYLESYLTSGLGTCIQYTYWEWGVDNQIYFWVNSIKFLWKDGPILGVSICWGHSVLQTVALVIILMIQVNCFRWLRASFSLSILIHYLTRVLLAKNALVSNLLHFSSPEPKAHWGAYRIGRPLSSVVVVESRPSSTLFKHLLFRKKVKFHIELL